MVQTAVLLLLHVPPVTDIVYIDILPVHIEELPAIAAGKGLTEIAFTVAQPVGSV
jgi:hypothetical protein